MSVALVPGGIVADKTVEKDEAGVLHEALLSIGIRAFSIESQFRHRWRVIWDGSSPNQRTAPLFLFLYRLSCLAVCFCCAEFIATFFVAFVNLVVPAFWIVCAVTSAAAALLFYAASDVEQPEVDFESPSLESYAEWEDVPVIPGEVMTMANKIEERCSQAEMSVIMLKMNGRVVDNFLYVQLGKAGFLVAKWRNG